MMISPEKALSLLQEGHVVVVPTETVYGLAADGYTHEAVEKIYTLKKRPSNNPLIFHYASQEHVQEDVVWTPMAQALAASFWPGPLTMVLERKKSSRLSPRACGHGLTSAAVRVPSHSIFQEMLRQYPHPLAAPSANPSGKLSPTTVHHVHTFWPEIPVVDGAPCTYGVESTIIDARGSVPIVLRPGAISVEAIEALLQQHVQSHGTVSVAEAPGMLHAHYQTSKPMRLNASYVLPHEGLLAFGTPLEGTSWVAQLSSSSCLQEAAKRLFSALHELDIMPCSSIAVMPIPHSGLGRALNDRLQRSACEKI